jgi:dipeptidyl aminopeptidase/acylaminoacyl peptidase
MSFADIEQAVASVFITDVQISPSGSQILYVVTPFSSEKGRAPASTVWLVPAQGGEPRQLTTSDASGSHARWSPDGKRVSFLSDRVTPGVPQIYVLDLDHGGEGLRRTDRESGVLGAEWSPDGASLAFTSPDDRADPDEDADALVVEDQPVPVGLWLLDVGSGETRRLTPEGMHVGGERGTGRHFDWAPDGSRLVTMTASSPRTSDQLWQELITVDLQGELRRSARFEAAFGGPRLSPDGTTIAFNGCDGPAPGYYVLQTVSVDGDEPTVLMQGAELSFLPHAWHPDGRLVAIVNERQRQRLAFVGDELTDVFAPLDRPGVVTAFSLSADGSRVAFVFGHDTSYGDVYVADVGGEARRLTDINPWTAETEFGEVREISWTSFDSLEIEGNLILPVGYRDGERYPLCLFIHGGPAANWKRSLNAHSIVGWGQFLARRGYAVLMPNPRGSAGRGVAFLRSIVGSYGDPDWRDLDSGVDKMIELGIADPDKLVLGGWSSGGTLTNWGITHTDRYKAAVSGAGVSNWVSSQGTADVRNYFDRYFGSMLDDPDNHWKHSAIRYVKAAKTPTLIVYGENDRRVPSSQGYELYEGLLANGVEVSMVIYPREGHVFVERLHQVDLVRRMIAWFDSHLD